MVSIRHKSVESLVLGAGSHLPLAGQVGQVLRNFRFSHVTRVPRAVVQNESFGSIDIGLPGPEAIVPRREELHHLVKEFRFLIHG